MTKSRNAQKTGLKQHALLFVLYQWERHGKHGIRIKGWKCLLHNKSQLSQGREILRYYVKRSMPICLSTAHWKVRDSSKRLELMLFFSGGIRIVRDSSGFFQTFRAYALLQWWNQDSFLGQCQPPGRSPIASFIDKRIECTSALWSDDSSPKCPGLLMWISVWESPMSHRYTVI